MQLRIDGITIGYDDDGTGPAVLFLHAFPLSRAMWAEQAAVVAAGGRRAIRIDARGFGDSPATPGPVTMEQIAGDAARLLRHLDAAPAWVCGLSMGGYAALAMSRNHPEFLSGLVLADTRAEPDDDEGRSSRATLAERVRERGVIAAAEAMLPRLLGETSLRERHALRERVLSWTLAADPEGVIGALAGLAARPDATPYLGQITVPLLLLCGEEDALTPPAAHERIRDAVPGSRLEILPRAGHLSNLENPMAFNRALMEALRGKQGGV